MQEVEQRRSSCRGRYPAVSEPLYSYSQFCARYADWLKRQKRSLRQSHRAGEKLIIDYAVPIVCASSGEIRQASILVAVLGASNYTYAEATWSQSLPDGLGSHVRAFEFFGGCPSRLVPDNLKSGVNKARRYEPELNPAYQQLAAHYDVAVLPARPYKPKDKAKAEVGVQLVERWILAKLRHQTFFSLAELNHCIRALLTELNEKPFKAMAGQPSGMGRTAGPASLVTAAETRLSVCRNQDRTGQYRLPRPV